MDSMAEDDQFFTPTAEDLSEHDNLMQTFVERWSLQEDAQNMLVMMDQASAQRVMDQFNPRDVSRDATAVFLKFASSVAAGMPDSQAAVDPAKVTQFIEQWSLGPEAQTILHDLIPAVQARVLREFHPRDKERDANGIFMKFAQGISQGKPRKGQDKGGGKGGGPGIVLASSPWHPHQQQYSPYQLQSGPQRQVRNAYVQHQAGAGADDVALQEFVLKWSLHEEAQSLLFALDAASQLKVVQEFSPRDTSRDCNAVFCKFVQCVSSGGGKGGFGAAAAFAPFKGAPRVVSPCKGGKGGGMAGGDTTSAAAFVAQWSLGPEAQTVLHELTPEAQQKVMLEFSPRDTSSPVDNIFMKFAQGVGRSPKGKGGKGARPAPYFV